MEFPGAGPPPEGVVPDLEHPQDVLSTTNYVTQGLTMALVTFFTALRIYAKFKVIGGKMAWDDYATYSCYIFMMGYCITACFAGNYGGGLNQWEVPKSHIANFFQAGYAATIFYAPMALTVKLALLLLIARVFGSVYGKTIYGIYTLIVMISLYYISGVFIKIFVCWPISAYWHGEMDKCLDQSAIITADAIISVVSDLAILLLPTPLTWSLQLPLRKRLRVTGMLCAGGIATAFSVWRLILILQDGKSTNQTIVFIQVILSGNAEVAIGLICACLPAVNALYVRGGKNTSYYAQQQSNTDQRNGDIVMTRTFHVETHPDQNKEANESIYRMGHDEAGLVASAQAIPQTGDSSRRSGSTS